MQLQYYGTLYFGTPAKPYTAVFDTGSSWIWLNDISCENCHRAVAFNSSDSSTYEGSDKEFTLQYGLGSGRAVLGFDTVSLGWGEGEVTRQPFLLMQETRDFEGLQADGLVVSATAGFILLQTIIRLQHPT